MSAILQDHYNILEESEQLKSAISEPPRVVYRRGRNIGDNITSSKVKYFTPSRCRQCGKPRFRVCFHKGNTTVAESRDSTFKFKTHGNVTCDSSNLVYLIHFTAGGMQHIDQTEMPFRIRFNNHKAHIEFLRILPLSKHMLVPGHSLGKLLVIILQSEFKYHYDRRQGRPI